MSAHQQHARGALEQLAEPNTPTLKLLEYIQGDRDKLELDIDEYLRAMRIARTLCARYEHRTRTEWLFPATNPRDTDAKLDGTGGWVLVMETEDEDEWHHQNRIHESSVVSRGLPEPEMIQHVTEVATVVPAVSLANCQQFGGGDGE